MVQLNKIDNRSNKELYIFPYGLDDLIVFISCLKVYKERNPEKIIHLAVLSPYQPAFNTTSYMNEYLDACTDIIEKYHLLSNVWVKEKDVIALNVGAIQQQVSYIRKFIKYDKVPLIQYKDTVVKNDYRFNNYFFFLTRLQIQHEKPVYYLPDTSSKKDNVNRFLQNNDIVGEYILVQLQGRNERKTIDKLIFDEVINKYSKDDLKKYKIIEINTSIIDGATRLISEDMNVLTLIELVRNSKHVICNISLLFCLAGILNKNTICFYTPNDVPINKDLIFDFKENLTLFAPTKEKEEYENLIKILPFKNGKDKFLLDAEVPIEEINNYNEKFKLGNFTKYDHKKIKEYVYKIEKKETFEKPVLWQQSDILAMEFGIRSRKIKFQALSGFHALEAYRQLKIDVAPVKVTNIFYNS